MQKVYRKFITKCDIEYLKQLHWDKNFALYRSAHILNTNNRVINKMLDALKEDFDFEVLKESYCRIEETPTDGRDWHSDIGSSGQMPWCQVGCSILLENNCDGGKMYYKEDDKVIEVERDVLDLCAHSSNVLHKIDPPNGYRLVFLIFI